MTTPGLQIKAYGLPTTAVAPFVPPELPDLAAAIGVPWDHWWSASQIDPRAWSDTTQPELPDAAGVSGVPMQRYVLDAGANEVTIAQDDATGVIYAICSGINFQAPSTVQLRPQTSTPYSFFTIFRSTYVNTAVVRLGGEAWSRYVTSGAQINFGGAHMVDPKTSTPNSATNTNNFLVMGSNMDPAGPIGNFDGIAVALGASYTPPTSNPFFQPAVIISAAGGSLNSKVVHVADIISVPAFLNAAQLAAGVECLRAGRNISYS